MFKEFFCKKIYDETTGLEIARIRVKLEAQKGKTKWSTTQLEGRVFRKWLPLIRYDFNPKERGKPPLHLHKEYLGNDVWEEFHYQPEELIEKSQKEMLSLKIEQIKELIKKREDVFRKEGK